MEQLNQHFRWIDDLGNAITAALTEMKCTCSTNPEVLNELKRRWMEAGQPELPNWDTLLRGL